MSMEYLIIDGEKVAYLYKTRYDLRSYISINDFPLEQLNKSSQQSPTHRTRAREMLLLGVF